MDIRPSKAYQWVVCCGSLSMQDHYPDDESDKAREGTACHEVAERLLRSRTDAKEEIVTINELVGTLASNNVLIDDEMCQAATDYVTDILMYCNQYGLSRSLHIEETISIDRIYQGMEGTPDNWVYNSKAIEVVLWDLKYGHGIVEIFENPQFLCYIAGILDQIGIDGITDQMLTIKMRVVQPRAFHQDGPIREWSIKASDLRGYFNNLAYAAQMAMSDGATCKTGIHCRYCTARHACTALGQTVYNVIDMVKGPVPIELSDNQLSVELQLLRRASNLIKYRLDAIDQESTSKVRSGALLPGFKIQETFGRKRWKKDTPIVQVLMMGDLMGVDLRKPENLDTPTQAKKKGLDEKVIKQYSETPKTGFKLVTDDGSKARQVFRK